jgi:hypothetical protein
MIDNKYLKNFLCLSLAGVCFQALAGLEDVAIDALLDANRNSSNTSSLITPEVRTVFSDEDIKKALSVLDTVDWSHALPVRSLMMVKTKDGETLLASPDGRLLIKGGLIIDGWNRRQILTESDAKNSWKAHLSSFGITSSDLPIYSYGVDKPDFDLYVFVDSLSSEANTILFDQIKSLANQYKFGLILTPVAQGKPSGARGRELWCAKDQNQSVDLLMSGDDYTEIETLENCDTSKIIKVIGLSQFMQIQRLPYLIASDGTHKQGAPSNLDKFIKSTAGN